MSVAGIAVECLLVGGSGTRAIPDAVCGCCLDAVDAMITTTYYNNTDNDIDAYN